MGFTCLVLAISSRTPLTSVPHYDPSLPDAGESYKKFNFASCLFIKGSLQSTPQTFLPHTQHIIQVPFRLPVTFFLEFISGSSGVTVPSTALSLLHYKTSNYSALIITQPTHTPQPFLLFAALQFSPSCLIFFGSRPAFDPP